MAEVNIYEGALDKGLEGVVACTTSISFIVGNNLNYRGYTIDDLAANSTFEETVFLLWNDRLPTVGELEKFKTDLNKNMALDPALINVLKTLPTEGVHPMAWLRTAVSLSAHWDADANDITTESNLRKAVRLTAKMGALVTAFEAIRSKREILNPVAGKSLAWNFMRMLKGSEPDPEQVKVFDICLILHADHELNCSAFATRVTTSSLSDMHSAIVSAIGALKGPLHGGANEQVMVMLAKIGTIENAKQFVKDALDAKEKVMGIGHRVYKDGDPRAAILRKYSKELTAKMGKPELYEISVMIDDTMNKEKGLMPNVDFYSATVYHALGIPTDIFTPIFAVSRVSGWIAHAMEQYEKNRIYRPRGKWLGKEGLKWQSADKR
ncbi:MAG: citrate synthase [Pseudobdellovibrio sp.]